MRRKLGAKSKIKTARLFAGRLKNELGDQLHALVLHDWVFGDVKEDFDIELVVLTEKRDQEVEDKVFQIAGDLELENDYELTLSPTITDSEVFERLVKRSFPMEREMLAEGYVLYDDGFFGRLRGSELAIG